MNHCKEYLIIIFVIWNVVTFLFYIEGCNSLNNECKFYSSKNVTIIKNSCHKYIYINKCTALGQYTVNNTNNICVINYFNSDNYHYNSTKLMYVENIHNGKCISLPHLQSYSYIANIMFKNLIIILISILIILLIKHFKLKKLRNKNNKIDSMV